MVTQRTGTADQNGGSARGCQGLFESLAAWHSRSRPWQADGQGLCINQPVAQSRAEGALQISDADTGAKLRPWRSWVLAWDGSLTVSPARGAASPTWPRIQAQRDEMRLRHPNRATATSPAPRARLTAKDPIPHAKTQEAAVAAASPRICVRDL